VYATVAELQIQTDKEKGRVFFFFPRLFSPKAKERTIAFSAENLFVSWAVH